MRRTAWSLSDQAASSLSNFLLLILVIRTSSTGEVGAFGLAYTTFFMLLAMSRGLAMEPLVVRYAMSSLAEWTEATRSATGLVLVAAGIVAAPGVLIGLWFGGALGNACAAVAVFLPALLLQDAWRLAFFGAGKPKLACLNDVLMLSLEALFFAGLAVLGHATMVSLILAWGLAACLASVLGMLQSRLVPRPGRATLWFRRHRDIAPAFAGDYLANRGGEQLALVAIGAVGGLGALGIVTASRSLFAPLTTIQSGVNCIALPEFSRLRALNSRRELQIGAWGLGTGMAGLMAVGGVGLLMLPDAFGVELFTSNWGPARSVLVPMTVFSVINALSYGLWIALRAMQVAKPTLYARITTGIVTIIGTSLGVFTYGASGAVWGLVVGASLLTVLMGVLFFRHSKAAEGSNRHSSTTSPELTGGLTL